MENQQKNNKIRQYMILFSITTIIFFIFEISIAFLQYHSFSSYLIISSLLAAGVAGMLAVFFYDMMTSQKRKNIIRFEFVEDVYRRNPREHVKLPEYATDASVGYDFFSPDEKVLFPGEKHMFWTDVKVRLRQGETLVLSPRSSGGIKKSLMLANTIGTIDPDYFGNENNDGNIGICLFNYGSETAHIVRGDRIAQGTVFNITRDKTIGNSKKRTGGLGSTGN